MLHPAKLLRLSVSLFFSVSLSLTSLMAQDALSAALQKASADQQLTLLLVTMADTRGSTEAAAEDFVEACGKDLRAATQVVRYVQQHEDSSAMASKVRELLLQGKHRDFLVAPQAVFLKPDGKVHAAVPGAMTRGQLEWAWARALGSWQKAAPKGPRSDACLPSDHYFEGEAKAWSKLQAPPPPDKMAGYLEAAEKASTFMRLYKQGLPLARSADPRALKVYGNTLGMCKEDSRMQFLERVAIFSPSEYGEIVARFLKLGSAAHRIAVCDTLCKLRSPAASAELLKQIRKKQPAPAVRHAMLRALVHSDPGNRRIGNLIKRGLRSREAGDRVQALLACERLERRADAQKFLRTGLTHKDPETRLAAAIVCAARDEQALREDLVKSLAELAEFEFKRVTEFKEALNHCLGVLRGERDRTTLAELRKKLQAG